MKILEPLRHDERNENDEPEKELVNRTMGLTVCCVAARLELCYLGLDLTVI